MESPGRFLLLVLLCSLILGMAVVLLDKEYRLAKIYETNRRSFSQVPVESPAED